MIILETSAQKLGTLQQPHDKDMVLFFGVFWIIIKHLSLHGTGVILNQAPLRPSDPLDSIEFEGFF